MRTKLISLAILAGLCASAPAAQASNGALDSSFSGDGLLQTNRYPMAGSSHKWGPNTILGLAVTPSGKTLISMSLSDCWSVYCAGSYTGTARYNPDGSLDTTFGDNGLALYGGAMATDSEGRIVLANSGSVVRLSADGDLDTAFSGDGSATVSSGTVISVKVDAADVSSLVSDGGYLACGASIAVGGSVGQFIGGKVSKALYDYGERRQW